MDQPVTISFVPIQVVTWIVIGVIAGFLAGLLIRGERMSLLRSILVGLAGAVVGGFLLTVLRIPIPSALNASLNIRLIDIIVAFLGAILVLLIVNLIWRRRIPG